ncbi:MAG: DUF4862 family protein [Bifidobacteriaceae bacterium]|nr:DUF4862 family protein [Bifidobacteriaceae bacterium]
MSKPFVVVGAYASLPAERKDQSAYYELLDEHSWISGTEIPFPGDLADPQQRNWLARHVPAAWHNNTITAIPGTMQNVWKNNTFGIASPIEDGRKAALKFFEELRNAIVDFNQIRGNNDISYVEIHTAPTQHAETQACKRSLETLLSWDWAGAKLVIEHCDRFIENQKPEKGFLPIQDEIVLAQEFGIGITVNWGRSVLEDRNTQTALEHIRAAVQAEVLKGVMFSGAGPEETQYGYSWIDGHLPMNPDEPTSLMTAQEILQCVKAANITGLRKVDENAQSMPNTEDLAYVGPKICVPKNASITERYNYLAHIYDAITEAL